MDADWTLAPWMVRSTNDSIAPVAQLDRVPGYELGGREFESLRARQFRCSDAARKGCFGTLCFCGLADASRTAVNLTESGRVRTISARFARGCAHRRVESGGV